MRENGFFSEFLYHALDGGVNYLSNLPNLNPSSQRDSVQAHGPSEMPNRKVWALRRKRKRRDRKRCSCRLGATAATRLKSGVEEALQTRSSMGTVSGSCRD